MKLYRKTYINLRTGGVTNGPWFRYRLNAQTTPFAGERLAAENSGFDQGHWRISETTVTWWGWLRKNPPKV